MLDKFFDWGRAGFLYRCWNSFLVFRHFCLILIKPNFQFFLLDVVAESISFGSEWCLVSDGGILVTGNGVGAWLDAGVGLFVRDWESAALFALCSEHFVGIEVYFDFQVRKISFFRAYFSSIFKTPIVSRLLVFLKLGLMLLENSVSKTAQSACPSVLHYIIRLFDYIFTKQLSFK